MSKKDLYRGADIVGKASEAKFTEISERLSEMRGDWNKFSKNQNVINKEVVKTVDNHDDRLQSLEDTRNFIRISRHSLTDLESNEQELLAGWLQKLVLELDTRGFSLNSNQQEFLSNIFKLIGLHDVLVEQFGGLEKLQNIGNSEFHEAVYKVFLVLCYLYDNNFNILNELEDIDYIFKLSELEKLKVKELLENERIPTLGTKGLVQMFEQGKPFDSFSIDNLVSRYMSINSHTLLSLGLNKENYATYLKSFALLVSENGRFTEKQRYFLLALASLFECKEIIFEVDELCKNPQSVDLYEWQSLLDTNEKKYAWGLDAAALLGLEPDFNPEEDERVEQLLKLVKLFDAREFLVACVHLTREKNSIKLFDSIKKVHENCTDWSHVVEYSGLSLKGAFSELISKLEHDRKLMEERFLSRFPKYGLPVFLRHMFYASIETVSDSVKEEWRVSFLDNNKNIRKANEILQIFGFDVIESDYIRRDLNGFGYSFSNQTTNQLSQIRSLFQNAIDTSELLIAQLELFEEGNFHDSILIKRQQERELELRRKEAEKEARRSVKITVGKEEKNVSIIWRDIKNLPFDVEDITYIFSNKKSWIILIGCRELFHSEDGENWTEVGMPEEIDELDPHCRYSNQYIKCVNEIWFLFRSDRVFYLVDNSTWIEVGGKYGFKDLLGEDALFLRGFNIHFFDGEWLLQCFEIWRKYSYTQRKKALFVKYSKDETNSYRAPLFYRAKSLQGPWKKWNNASDLSEGLIYASDSLSLGIHNNALTASFKFDRYYEKVKSVDYENAGVLYITSQGKWKPTTWPKNEVESIEGNFYFWNNQSFYFDEKVLLRSPNGYEWNLVTKDLPVDITFLDVSGLLFLPRVGGNTAYISSNGLSFSEINLSEGDEDIWDHIATTDKEILARFKPSKHETHLRLGTLQMVDSDE